MSVEFKSANVGELGFDSKPNVLLVSIPAAAKRSFSYSVSAMTGLVLSAGGAIIWCLDQASGGGINPSRNSRTVPIT